MDKALLVGINDYGWGTLNSCVADVHKLAPLLGKHANGMANYECKLLTSDKHKVTADLLKENIASLFGSKAGRVLFYFSGHGNEELGGTLSTYNGTKYNPGVPLVHLLNHAHKALEARRVHEVVVLLDCCFSGTLGDLPLLGEESALLKKGLALLTASQHNEFAKARKGTGVFTRYLVEALQGATTDVLGHVTLASTYYYMDQALGAWNQRPNFKAHVDTMPILRQVTPMVVPEVLRQLPHYFPELDAQHPLSPAYPNTEAPHNAEQEEIFSHLLQYQHAGLLVPAGPGSMYQEAMAQGSCHLTPMGKAYWQLASAGKV